MIRVNGRKFKRSKFLEALVYADGISEQNTEGVTVILPGKTISLYQVACVTKKVKIHGSKKTKILLKKDANILVEGELHCQDVRFHNKTRGSRVAVTLLNGYLRLQQCQMISSTVNGFGKLEVCIEDTSFIKDKPCSEVVAAAFEGHGVVEVRTTTFGGYSDGVTVKSDPEGELMLISDENYRGSIDEHETFNAALQKGRKKDASGLLAFLNALHNLPAAETETPATNVKPQPKIIQPAPALKISAPVEHPDSLPIEPVQPQRMRRVSFEDVKLIEEVIALNWQQQTCEELVSLLSFLVGKDIVIDHLLEIIARNSPLKSLKISLNEEFVTEEDMHILPIDQLLDWWVQEDIYFLDKAIDALDTLLGDLDIESEEYDVAFASLDDLWHKNLMGLEDQQLSDYFISVIAVNPMKAWYLLEKLPEDSRVKQGIMLRLMMGVYDFSWVSYWVATSVRMVRRFMEMPAPPDTEGRILWANTLLDANKIPELDVWYEVLQPETLTIDTTIKFEYHTALNTVKFSRTQKLSALLANPLHETALTESIKSFNGLGVLPGYIRRTSCVLRTIREIQLYLAPVFKNFTKEQCVQHQCLVLALFDSAEAHNLTGMPALKPQIGDAAYDTCEVCYAEKLKPWNQMKLSSCSKNHAYCLSCARKSMSTGDRDLWGICPGQDDEGEQCQAKANRREMQMCGMETKKIYNILSVRYFEYLEKIPNWCPCEICGLGGGVRTAADKKPKCVLCSYVMGQKEAGENMIQRLLLKGLKASKSYRGKGVFRECYHCAVPIEKGDACSSMTCTKCKGKFDFVKGPNSTNHRFDNEGVAAQQYVPLTKGILWKLGVFKTRSGRDLTPGQTLSSSQKHTVQSNAARIERKLARQA